MIDREWTTKDEYLTFVSEWKATYKALSRLIRIERLITKARCSLHSGSQRFEPVQAKLPIWEEETRKLRAFVSELTGDKLWYPSELAKLMLDWRAEEKLRAGVARSERIASEQALVTA